MTKSIDFAEIQQILEKRLEEIFLEIRSYPSPIAGCDQQFNFLLEQRGQLSRLLQQVKESRSGGDVGKTLLAELDTFLSEDRVE